MLVRYHMEPLRIATSSHFIEKTINLFGNIRPDLLLPLKKFDILGSIPEDKSQTTYDLYLLESIGIYNKKLEKHYAIKIKKFFTLRVRSLQISLLNPFKRKQHLNLEKNIEMLMY